MSFTHLSASYLRHLLKARDEHSIHSPFIFDLYTTCFRNKSHFYAFDHLEGWRTQLKRSNETITVADLGAGSQINKGKQRAIRDIAKNSLTPPRQAQQLFRLVNYLQPKNIVEFGTSLGLTTAYLASAARRNSRLYTMEGCPETAQVARNLFKKLSLHNIELIEGDFTNSLQRISQQEAHFDLVYFDGNHSYAPTMEYFNTCMEKATENSCFIFDDIYWSEGMTKAWHEIRQDPRVTLSMDTFYFGICFFRSGQPKQHFILR